MWRWRRERRFLRLGCRENSSGSRSGGGDGRRLADGVAVDHKFDAAIALTALGGIVRSDGLRFAEAVSGHGRGCNTLFGEKIADAVAVHQTWPIAGRDGEFRGAGCRSRGRSWSRRMILPC